MRSVMLVVVAMATAGCGSSTSNSAASTEQAARFSQISVGDVAAAMNAPDRQVVVYDANDRETFEEQHVPGATWVDYHAVSREQLPADTSTPVVFYCYNEACSASHMAAESACEQGFTNVSVMGAGIRGWAASGQPVEGTAANAPAAPAEGAPAAQ